LARAGLPVASGRDLRVLSDVSFRPWLDDLGALAVLVRPDRYVLGAARTPEELNALLASVQSSTIESK
jgi:3-(3-hydroxy-phenyl)propionate hydroxylase